MESSTAYCDWSIRRGVAVVWNDEDDVKYYPDLGAVLEAGARCIILESTFDSFDRDNGDRDIAAARLLGVSILTISSRVTSRFRKAGGFGEKDDAADAKAIRYAAQSGMHLKVPGKASDELIAKRIEANTALMYLRSHGEHRPRPKASGYTFTSLKESMSAEWAALLPDFKGLPEVTRTALSASGGKGYNLTIVAAVGVAAYFAENGSEFDYLSGLYQHGYPTQIRADLMHWAWAGGGTRAKLNGVPEDGIRKRDDLTLSDFRREIRRLGSQLKDITKNDTQLKEIAEKVKRA